MSRADQTARSHTHPTTTTVDARGGVPFRLASFTSFALLVLAPSIGLAHGDADAHADASAHCAMHPASAQSPEEPSPETHTAAAHAGPGSSTSTPSESRTTNSIRDYAVPAVQLVRDDGKPVSLTDEMNDGRPIVMNFIFTTCTTICPVMSNVFSQFERRLGPDAEKVHLMSISIDPERDTPARLIEYARKFHAGPEWRHYTGTLTANQMTVREVWVGGRQLSVSGVGNFRMPCGPAAGNSGDTILAKVGSGLH